MNFRNNLITTTILVAALSPFSAFAATEVDNVKADIKEAGAKVATAADDAAITAKVKALLAVESDIRSLKISVTTKNSVVYLEGTVDTRLQESRVIELAQSVKGVTDVNESKLKVTSSNNFFEDALITAKTKGKIMQLANEDKIASGYDLHVETTNGVVHIFGKVTDRNDIAIVEKSVGAISDVKSVKTNIDIVKQ
jgi:hyperosmotically inducible protein